MNEPHDKSNFLIEVTPEQLDELRKIYRHVDDDGYVEMHYSPYWKQQTPAKASPKEEPKQ